MFFWEPIFHTFKGAKAKNLPFFGLLRHYKLCTFKICLKFAIFKENCLKIRHQSNSVNNEVRDCRQAHVVTKFCFTSSTKIKARKVAPSGRQLQTSVNICQKVKYWQFFAKNLAKMAKIQQKATKFCHFCLKNTKICYFPPKMPF